MCEYFVDVCGFSTGGRKDSGDVVGISRVNSRREPPVDHSGEFL